MSHRRGRGVLGPVPPCSPLNLKTVAFVAWDSIQSALNPIGFSHLHSRPIRPPVRHAPSAARPVASMGPDPKRIISPASATPYTPPRPSPPPPASPPRPARPPRCRTPTDPFKTCAANLRPDPRLLRLPASSAMRAVRTSNRHLSVRYLLAKLMPLPSPPQECACRPAAGDPRWFRGPSLPLRAAWPSGVAARAATLGTVCQFLPDRGPAPARDCPPPASHPIRRRHKCARHLPSNPSKACGRAGELHRTQKTSRGRRP
jgi:hypothetical protein